MVTALAVLGVLLVLFVAGVVATRDDVAMSEAPPDRADLDLPDRPLRADDVRRVRFGVTLRGYRMSEVDLLLERLAAQLEPAQERPEHEAPPEAPPRAPHDAAVAAPAVHGDDGA